MVNKVKIFINDSERLYNENEIIDDRFTNVEYSCNGSGRCGKCKVRTNGLSSVSNADILYLTAQEIENGYRLLCQIRAVSGLYIYLDDARSNKSDDNYEQIDEVATATPGSLGLAIDLGTTTIVMSIVTETGILLEMVSEVNYLRKYGHDIISRVTYMLTHPDNAFKSILIDQLKKMIKGSKLKDRIRKTVVVGNTIMLHILLGLDIEQLVYPPHENQIDDDAILSNELLGLTGDLIIVRPYSTFIGSDVTLGLLSTIEYQLSENYLYIDLGTNGEIAYCDKETVYIASTAAGPAFEGGHIACGTGSISGAIFRYNGESFETINDASPIGICGSGLIDIVSFGLETDVVDHSGRLSSEQITLTNTLYVNQKDIREVQLAKGAIYSHIELLTKGDFAKISKIYIAGAFGHNLNLRNAMRIGLFPRVKIDKYQIIGNGALRGAVKVLIDSNLLAEHTKLLERLVLEEYDKFEGFSDLFIKNLDFEVDEDE